MVRKVVSTDQVAHLWANQSQPEARNSSRSCSFDGDTLYSYITPIARIVTDKRGERVALLTSHGYSMTTSGHASAVRGACRHMPHYRVPALGAYGGRHREPSGNMHAANVAYLANEYAEQVASFMRAQSPHSYEYLERLAETVADYARRFNIQAPGPIDTASDIARITARFDRLAAMRARPEYGAKREAERAKREARRQAKIERERELRAASAAEKLAAWRAGEIDVLPYDARGRLAALRIRGNVIQTSQGASVPVADARRACEFIMGRKRIGAAWECNGEHFPVGQFELDGVSANGDVRAGCHLIEWEEVAALAAALGVQS